MDLLSVLLSVVLPFTTGSYYPSPSDGLSPEKIIQHYGYVHETHYITTEDGYILQYHRIPHGINNTSEKNGPPILLMHGLGVSGADFITAGPKYSLGYFLADLGYDVWIANARGNLFSRNHTKLDPDRDTETFYDFSWHEIGYYDIPNAIDYILKKNGADSLYYIGHSQGTTAFLVFASTRPEYSSKVKRASLMAPVAFFNNIPDKLYHLMATFKFLIFGLKVILLDVFHYYEVNLATTVRNICNLDPIVSKVCFDFYRMTHQNEELITDDGLIPVIFANFPSTFATKQIIHYGQVITMGDFVKYDSGQSYDLQSINIPIALYYGENDGLTDIKDLQTLSSKVKHVYDFYQVPGFGHADFAYNKHSIERLYDRMMNKMSEKIV